MLIRRPHDFGALVRAARQKRGLSQTKLAALLGVRRLWVGEFELGKSGARLDLVMHALNELGVTLDAEMDGSSEDMLTAPKEPISTDDDVIDSIASTGTADGKARGRRR